MDKNDYVCGRINLIKEYGLTNWFIEKYLKDPDLIKPNRYKIGRVKQIIKNNQTDFELCQKRKQISKKSNKTKLNNNIQLINEIITEIEVTFIRRSELIRLTKENFEYFHNRPLKGKCDNKLLVNFIRHNLTSYDEDLEYIQRKIGKEQLLNMLRKAIYLKIIDVYPDLKKECINQLKERGIKI